jgi:hypothetical protein
LATKKAGTTPAKKSATKSADAPKPAAKKAATKAPSAEAESVTKLPGKRKPPTHDEIAQLAHTYWQQRGSHHGSEAEDWLRAERELNA